MIFRGSFGLVTYQRKLILMLRDNNPAISQPNKWCAIGGGPEPGETLVQVYRREVQEEICIDPMDVQFLCTFEIGDHQYAAFASQLSDEEAGEVKLGNEGQRLEYFNLEQLSSIEIVPTHREFLTRFPEVVRKYVD